MILQALVQHYEDLLAAGEVVRPGWARAKVSYGLDLSGDGRLLGLLPLQTEQVRGKKAVMAPRMMEVPMPVSTRRGYRPIFCFTTAGICSARTARASPSAPPPVLPQAKRCIWNCLTGLPPRLPGRWRHSLKTGIRLQPPLIRRWPKPGKN